MKERIKMTINEILSTDENYKSILAYEKNAAEVVSEKVVEKPELSAWMILIPIVFIPFMQRHKRYKESATAFCEGYLYTKKIALDTAYKITKNEISCEDAPEIIKTTVQKNPAADPRVLKIYDKQIQEIEMLCEHYGALLRSGKALYGEMVAACYKTEDNYLNLINKLSEAEKEVTMAASATFKDGVAEVPEIMEKMEKYLLEFRVKKAKEYFAKE